MRTVIFLFSIACLLPAQQVPRVVAIRCGRLIDGKSAAVRSNAVIVIEGERIREVGASVPAGAQVIDGRQFVHVLRVPSDLLSGSAWDLFRATE